jgi:hypothetical protein
LKHLGRLRRKKKKTKNKQERAQAAVRDFISDYFESLIRTSGKQDCSNLEEIKGFVFTVIYLLVLFSGCKAVSASNLNFPHFVILQPKTGALYLIVKVRRYSLVFFA